MVRANGSESGCAAVMIDEGFAIPLLQTIFVDPGNRACRYRADFVMATAGLTDCRRRKYDGTQKYVDPQMTGRRSVQTVVQMERT